jgi:predicted MFS family arabinose efflux permease
MAALSQNADWRPVVGLVSICLAVLVPVSWLLMRESPSDLGLGREGEAPMAPVSEPPSHSLLLAVRILFAAARQPTFWLLFSGFFVCGLTTNGLVAAHLIAFCGDRGISPVHAAGLLSLMGFFDLFGAMASGWLTDRFDPRKLLVPYLGIRGLSLVALPFMHLDAVSLTTFAIFFGLDWIATVPPTLKLTNARFGQTDGPVVYGWIFTGHQAGAATAALGAGVIRQWTGAYNPAFVIGGLSAILIAGVIFVWRLRVPAARLAARG